MAIEDLLPVVVKILFSTQHILHPHQITDRTLVWPITMPLYPGNVQDRSLQSGPHAKIWRFHLSCHILGWKLPLKKKKHETNALKILCKMTVARLKRIKKLLGHDEHGDFCVQHLLRKLWALRHDSHCIPGPLLHASGALQGLRSDDSSEHAARSALLLLWNVIYK